MIVACHQPNYLPWTGYFYKIMKSDVFVAMDSVQFPRGRSWVNRNRIKTDKGNSWLTVPVQKKGKGLQNIRDVLISNEHNWKKKHLLSLFHCYKKAPYFNEYIPFFEDIYKKDWEKLLSLNLCLLKFIIKELDIDKKIILCSEIDAQGKGTDLILDICKKVNGVVYLSGYGGRKYIDKDRLEKNGIRLEIHNFKSPVYPQLFGDYISNLSIVDILFNCGKKAKDIISV